MQVALNELNKDEKAAYIAKMVPEIWEQIHRVPARQIYKLLQPLAMLDDQTELVEDIIATEVIAPLKADCYSNWNLFSSEKEYEQTYGWYF